MATIGYTLDIQEYLLAPNQDDQTAIAREAANNLKSKKIKLVDIVRALGEPLFSTDATVRVQAIKFLADLLLNLDDAPLYRTDVSLLVRFLTNRFDTDPVGLKEAAQALDILRAMRTFDPADSLLICEKAFEHLANDFSKQAVSSRLMIYKLLQTLLDEHREIIREAGAKFIDGFLALCGNERDPRNLMICFSMIHVVMIHWEVSDLVHCKDSLWETISRYFPITFKPRADDPIGITADDLKLVLRACFAESSLFAGEVFPFLIQKLDDQVTANVKKDIMRTFTQCAFKYDQNTIATWSTQLWDALKYEVLNATEDEIGNEVLTTLQAIAERLSTGLTIQTLDETPLLRYINAVVMECTSNILQRGSRLEGPSIQILGSIAAASPFAFHLIVRGSMPLLIAAFERQDATIAERQSILNSVNRLLDAKIELLANQHLKSFPAASIVDKIIENSPDDTVQGAGLSHYCDTLCNMFASALTGSYVQEVSFRSAGVDGLRKLVTLPNFLTRDEVGAQITLFTSIVLADDPLDQKVRLKAVQALQEAAALHSEQVSDVTFPGILSRLPDRLTHEADGQKYAALLEVLGGIAHPTLLFDTFVRRLLHKLDVVIEANSDLAYAHVILAGILFGIEQRIPSATTVETRDFELYKNLIVVLLRKVTEVHVRHDAQGKDQRYIGLKNFSCRQDLAEQSISVVRPDAKLIELIGKIAMTAIRSMSLEQQAIFAPEVFTFFVNIDAANSAEILNNDLDNGKEAVGEEVSLETQARRVLLQTQLNFQAASEEQRSTLPLSLYLLAGLRREVVLNFDAQEICCRMIRYVDECKDASSSVLHQADQHSIRMSIIHMVCLLANKSLTKAASTSLPKDIIRGIALNLSSRTDRDTKENIILIISFIRALNLQGDREARAFLQLAVDGLADQRFGLEFAKLFGQLLKPSIFLSKENHAVIRAIYQQRVFGTCVPAIVTQFKACADHGIKTNYLVALAGILTYVPSEIVMSEIDTLLPLLLQSLDAPGDKVKAASIDVLYVAIKESPSAVEGHIQGIVKRLISTFSLSTTNAPAVATAVRAKSLICLAAIPQFLNLTVILPFRLTVMKEVGAASSDSKRAVRTQAVDCRTAWFKVASDSDEVED